MSCAKNKLKNILLLKLCICIASVTLQKDTCVCVVYNTVQNTLLCRQIKFCFYRSASKINTVILHLPKASVVCKMYVYVVLTFKCRLIIKHCLG